MIRIETSRIPLGIAKRMPEILRLLAPFTDVFFFTQLNFLILELSIKTGTVKRVDCEASGFQNMSVELNEASKLKTSFTKIYFAKSQRPHRL